MRDWGVYKIGLRYLRFVLTGGKVGLWFPVAWRNSGGSLGSGEKPFLTAQSCQWTVLVLLSVQLDSPCLVREGGCTNCQR